MDNNIKKLRQNYKRKLTQEELAKEIGVTKLTISRWENNERTPKADKAKVLADFFEVDLEYLLGTREVNFGKTLKDLREMHYLTIDDAAKELDIDVDILSELENQKEPNVSKKMLKKLSKFFDVDIEFLEGKTNVLNREQERKYYLENFDYLTNYKPSDEEIENQINDLKRIQNFERRNRPFFKIDYSMLIDFKYDEEGLSETKLKTLDLYNELNTEYKKMLFINAIDLIDESKEKDILKMADNIQSIQENEELNRKMWLEEMEYAHKHQLESKKE
ncbi:helix-turn-helix domain-containing protein [Streptococcus uberis]|uniref:helix-turn-helix domain-containing protein n=1 Tax=Streptococcus uberis TaxID=1349 RepID=UPI00193A392D|nr:helix-turn-helix transcriptional regulator [Streptococcus uberis]